jgi:hypothetical protein
MDLRAVPPVAAGAVHDPERAEHAPGQALEDSDPFADSFFTRTTPDSLAPKEIAGESDAWEDDHDVAPTRLGQGNRRAMFATLGMLGGSVVALGAFLLYARVLMPAPVETGGPFDAVLPVPLAATSANIAVSGVSGTTPIATAASAPAPAEIVPVAQDSTAVPQRDESPAPSARRTSKSASSSIDTLIKRAYRDLNSGNTRAALVTAQKALAHDARRADAWIVLGSAYDTLRDRAGAAHAFRSSAELARGPYVAQCRALARRL